MLGQTCAPTWHWGWLALGTEPNPRATWGHQVMGLPCLCARSSPITWLQTLRGPGLIGPASKPSSLGSYVRTQYSWLLQQNSVLLGPASGPKAKGSCVRNHFSWVLCKYPYPDSTTLSTTTDPNYNPLGSGHERSPPS